MPATDAAMWEALVSWFVPVLISLLTQATWDSKAKVAITVVTCVVVGFVTAYVTGTLTTAGLSQSILIVLFGAMTAYKRFWVPLGMVNRGTQ